MCGKAIGMKRGVVVTRGLARRADGTRRRAGAATACAVGRRAAYLENTRAARHSGPGGARPADDSAEVTRLLRAVQSGDESALARLIPLVYDEPRRLARRNLRREETGHTLQTTALIHEARLRLADVPWELLHEESDA